MKKLLFLPLLFITSISAFAQHNTNSLDGYQDSLLKLSKKMINDSLDMERKNANYAFIKTLVSALKINNSFLYHFDSLKTIGIVNSPDNRFRIFSWYILNDDGSYRFYGTIQMNTGGALQMFPMEDYSSLIKKPEDSVSTPAKWLGAEYYKIISVHAQQPYYVLLGWKGNNVQSTKKVIEVLSFKNNKPQFGLAVFDGNGKTRKRVVFEYTRQASMLLQYIPERNLIVFDHLAPPDPKMKDRPETYGPDLTYDGYQLKNGRWQYVENLDMRNMPNDKDKEYISPVRKSDQ
jgi:hypothetical protein